MSAHLAAIRSERPEERRQRRTESRYRAMLLEAIRTPKVFSHTLSGRELNYYQAAILWHFQQNWHFDCLRMLRLWLRSRDTVVVCAAAETIGASEQVSLIPVIKRLLQHKHPRVVARTLFGVRLSAHHASKTFRLRLLPLVLPFCDGRRFFKSRRNVWDSWDVASHASEAVRMLCPERAWQIFATRKILTPTNPAAVCVLWDMHESADEFPRATQKPIKPELLWPLFDCAASGKFPELRKGESERLMGLVLVHAAKTDPSRVRLEARAVLQRKSYASNELADRAREALRAVKGVPEVSALMERFHKSPRRFSGPAADVLRCCEFASEIVNDGFELYWHNLGDHWVAVRRGLRILRLDKVLKTLMNGATIVFAGKPNDRATLSAIRSLLKVDAEQKSRDLDRIDRTLQRQVTSVFRAVERYIDCNASVFTKQ